MSSIAIRVGISDGGIAPATDLPSDTRIVRFYLPDGAVLEVEAFLRHGEATIQMRTDRGAPYVLPRSGNVMAVGIIRDR